MLCISTSVQCKGNFISFIYNLVKRCRPTCSFRWKIDITGAHFFFSNLVLYGRQILRYTDVKTCNIRTSSCLYGLDISRPYGRMLTSVYCHVRMLFKCENLSRSVHCSRPYSNFLILKRDSPKALKILQSSDLYFHV